MFKVFVSFLRSNFDYLFLVAAVVVGISVGSLVSPMYCQSTLNEMTAAADLTGVTTSVAGIYVAIIGIVLIGVLFGFIAKALRGQK